MCAIINRGPIIQRSLLCGDYFYGPQARKNELCGEARSGFGLSLGADSKR